MTKGQAARALANAIGELKDVDVQLQYFFTLAGLKWADFEGPATSRLFQAICRATLDQLRVLVDETAKRFPGQREELQLVLSQFLALPGTVWDGTVAREFIKACPYPGMRSFTSPKGFYGREELSAQIRHKSDQNPLILVTGASGSGKSSVVMAGVFPGWKQDFGEDTTFQIRPEGNPFEALYAALFQSLGPAKAEQFRAPSRDVFTRLAKFLAAEGVSHPLFFVDPFEKVFAAESETGKQYRDDFVASLVDFAQQNSDGAQLILGMRDDFLGALSKFPDLCRFTDANIVRVFPLDEDSLRQAIQHPAADHGVEVDHDVVEDIIDKVLGRSGMLPLMQDVLKSLWDNAVKVDLAASRRLTANTYFALGGVLGSLTNRLDAICREKGEDRLRRIFLRTVQVATDQTTPAISRRGHREELSESDRLILDDLIDKKVLVTFDSAPGQTQGTFGLPHEAVIQNWDKLKTWITDSRHVLTLLSRLNEDVRERQRKLTEHPDQATQIDEECLWRGGRLEDLTKLAASDFEQLGFTTEMQEFLAASQRQQQEEQGREIRLAQEREAAATERAESARINAESETRLKKSAFKAAGVALALMVVAFLISLVAWSYRRESEQNLATAKTKTKEVEVLLKDVRTKSGELRVELNEAERRIDLTKLREAQWAWDNNNLELVEQYLDEVKPEHRSTIAQQTTYPCFVWNYLKRQSLGGLFSLYGHTSGVTSVASSPDGQRIVSGSHDNTARVWDARTGKSLVELLGHTRGVTSVAFSPDGQRIATGSNDDTARVWDARTGQSLVELQGHTSGVSSVAFSLDGQRIVSGSRDQTVRVWDARTGQLLVALQGHTGPVTSVGVSPDGMRIVTGSYDNTARVWDARTGHSSIELQGHTQSVSDVAFSPDGQWIVAYDVTDTARVWNATTGALIPDANNPPDTLPEGRISPDQKFLLLPRFKKVLVIPLAITLEDQDERKARTCPRPDLHRREAERLKADGEQFAAQVQRALEQQALGQEKVDAGKPEEAQPFFDKAHQLWPKPVPMEPPPVAEPAVSPPPPPEPTRIP